MKDGLKMRHIDEKQQPCQTRRNRLHTETDTHPDQQQTGNGVYDNRNNVSGAWLIASCRESPPLDGGGDGAPGAMLAICG